MASLFPILLILHFLGLAMGLSVAFSGMVMGALIAKSEPAAKASLSRFMPMMSRVGDVGLVLLWGSGLGMLFGKWGGFASMPGTFHAKITLVVLLTLVVGYIHSQQAKLRKGDAGAQGRIEKAGRVTFLLALGIVALAVYTFY